MSRRLTTPFPGQRPKPTSGTPPGCWRIWMAAGCRTPREGNYQPVNFVRARVRGENPSVPLAMYDEYLADLSFSNLAAAGRWLAH
jgi:hypothetical protein